METSRFISVLILVGITISSWVAPSSSARAAAVGPLLANLRLSPNVLADASTTLRPTADTYVDSSAAAANFGTANPLIASAAVRRILLRFDTRSLAGSVIKSVVLKVYARTTSSGGFEIHREGDAWAERSVTWNNQPGWSTSVLATSTRPVAGTWIAIPLPVTSVNTNGNTNYGIRFSVSGINAQISSREDAVNKPQLAVTYALPIVAAAGDIVDTCAGTSCGYYRVSDVILGMQPKAVLALGDISNNAGAMSDYTGPFGNSWGRFKSIITPAPGNHDYGTAGAANYYAYFGTAAHGPGGYYSYNLGNWHFVAINSNCSQVAGGCARGSPQEQWLKADLAANPRACTIAFWHHPRYSSGHDGDNTFMSDLFQDLYDAGAEIVLSAHSHDYERFAPQNNASQLDMARGISQFVVGTGGVSWTGFGTIKPNSRVRQNIAHGALQLTLHANSYDWRFIPEAGQTWTDSGSASCH